MKLDRQAMILEIIAQENIETQVQRSPRAWSRVSSCS